MGGVGLLLAGVLNLVGNLLKGLGLDGLLRGILSATVSSPLSLRFTLFKGHDYCGMIRALTKYTRDSVWGTG